MHVILHSALGTYAWLRSRCSSSASRSHEDLHGAQRQVRACLIAVSAIHAGQKCGVWRKASELQATLASHSASFNVTRRCPRPHTREGKHEADHESEWVTFAPNGPPGPIRCRMNELRRKTGRRSLPSQCGRSLAQIPLDTSSTASQRDTKGLQAISPLHHRSRSTERSQAQLRTSADIEKAELLEQGTFSAILSRWRFSVTTHKLTRIAKDKNARRRHALLNCPQDAVG